ncbi:hypothetical protein JKJ07_32170 [Actinoplanes sp. LDG1-01]|uniref:Uncharacterized protein n=2 Tax=Paractinoplanes lichenicola TaxID=2802976 RepID=A0ABS1VWW9_9ACTN|nr:hypothetical protein [Actinoplanes lichenicola]
MALAPAQQTVLVEVDWNRGGLTGELGVIALDGRVTPPTLLAVAGSWTGQGDSGSTWLAAYNELAGRYDWLRGIGDHTTSPDAVTVPATTSGGLRAWMYQPTSGAAPFTSPDQIVVALIRVDRSGNAQWARRIKG